MDAKIDSGTIYAFINIFALLALAFCNTAVVKGRRASVEINDYQRERNCIKKRSSPTLVILNLVSGMANTAVAGENRPLLTNQLAQIWVQGAGRGMILDTAA